MRPYVGIVLLCLPLFPEPTQADVTLRYESRVTVNPGLPAEMQQELTKIFAARLPPLYVQKFKNGKLFFSYGDDEAIVDFDKRQITLLEGETKRYSIIPIEQYLKEVVGVAPVAAPTIEDGVTLRSHSDSISTGQTAVISGVQAEERNILLIVDTSAATVPVVRVVIRVLNATEGEVKRVPALAELAPYNIRISEVTNPMISLSPGFQQLPDLTDGFTSMAGNFRPEDTVMRRGSGHGVLVTRRGSRVCQKHAGRCSVPEFRYELCPSRRQRNTQYPRRRNARFRRPSLPSGMHSITRRVKV